MPASERCSSRLDPALAFYIGRATGTDNTAAEAPLNKESGLQGLCGANDMREVLNRRDAGDTQARLAFEVYCYRIRKYIGAYRAVLGRVDALVFTAGTGENAPAVRACACSGLAVRPIAAGARQRAPGISGDVSIRHGRNGNRASAAPSPRRRPRRHSVRGAATYRG